MSIQSSAPSARSFLSPTSNGYGGNDGQTSAILASYAAAYTKSLPSSKSPNETMNLNPDELFAKHTVSEVRTVQYRLRADADAKQEELRLMVGERYRDLLQASSSIIAIAKSSRRVLEAIEECRDSIRSQNDLPPPPKTAMVDGVDDRHLFTLQVLSAHMKLLLDAPEHLWRLIERKKYLQAAWLFLLARVVHRALVRHDENDEQAWVSEGVDVATDFPLVQRQWDVVSQFRSQIIHKSTLSLRESTSSTEETCAILVTLHLLDSRPLNETLSAILSQRSKSLQTVLAWAPDAGPTQNGAAKPEGHNSATHSVSVREVTQVMKNALSTIAQTVCTSRTIFQRHGSEPSLIDRVLESIQSESETPDSVPKLPVELQLSTQSLLSQLTSSANFQLLPPDLRSYKPYVDLNSSSATLTQAIFSQKLQEWFRTSSDRWKSSASQWFSGINTVKEVWTLRSSVRRFISTSRLEDLEKGIVSSNLDYLCHDRILDIWKKTLSGTEDDFKRRIHSSISVTSEKEPSPADFLFSPPPIPVVSHSAKTFVDTPFQKYQLTLKRQLVGRSSHLDKILSTLEQCARTIHQDFSHIRGNGDEKTKPFVERLSATYQPAADSMTSKVVELVDEAIDVSANSTASTEGLLFLSRVTDNLFSTSSFILHIGCNSSAASDFKSKLSSLNNKALGKWRDIAVKRIVSETLSQFRQQPSKSTGPSPALLRSFLSLCDSLRRLGIIFHPVKQTVIVQDTLRQLINSLVVEHFDALDDQAIHDLAFLRKLSGLFGARWADITSLLDRKLKSAVPDDTQLLEVNDMASEHFARTQTMFFLLLPLPPTLGFDTPLLQFGVPSVGQNFNSAIDIAKPSPRFGMLLVGKTD